MQWTSFLRLQSVDMESWSSGIAFPDRSFLTTLSFPLSNPPVFTRPPGCPSLPPSTLHSSVNSLPSSLSHWLGLHLQQSLVRGPSLPAFPQERSTWVNPHPHFPLSDTSWGESHRCIQEGYYTLILFHLSELLTRGSHLSSSLRLPMSHVPTVLPRLLSFQSSASFSTLLKLMIPPSAPQSG